MKKFAVRRLLAAALAVTPLLAGPLLQAKEAGVEAKIALEESLERRLKSVISQILGTDDVIVIVTAEMYTAEEQKTAELPAMEESVLPGVPMKEKIGEPALAALALSESRTLIKKLSATIVLDVGVPESDVNVIKNATMGLLGLKTDRGDALEIQRMDFHRGEPKGFNWKRFITPPDLWWTMGLGLLAFFILFITAFFFGSFRVFIREFVKALRSYAESMEEQIKMMQLQKTRESELAAREGGAEAAREVESLLNRRPAAGAAPAGVPAAGGENGKNGAPFSFINESHLRNLKFLLRQERADVTAIVVNYLPPPLANEILSSLSPALQSEVMAQLSSIGQKDPEAVKAVEEKMREQIAFVIGGEDRLQALLDHAAPEAQKALLAQIGQKNAALAEKLRGRLFTIEDLVKLEGPVLAVVVRRVNARALAGVLRETPAELQEQILSKLPAGGAAILREEISLSKPLPPQRLAAEQRRILDTLRRLNEEGVIQLRKEEAN